MTLAKIFWSGNSQAVRLPKTMRFPKDWKEVEIRKEGEGLILEPRRPKKLSQEFLDVLGSMPEFRRPKQVRTRRKRIFP